MRYTSLTYLALTGILLAGCGSAGDDPANTTSNPADVAAKTPVISYSVTHYYPHDVSLFTEGFTFYNGLLYEGTGSPDTRFQTLIGPVDLATGKMDPKIKLDNSLYFGEGITFLNGKLYQLTYKNQQCFVYDARSFRRIGTFSYQNKEGWGLTTDGTSLIMSDGTDVLTYLSPDSLKPVKSIKVTESGNARNNLNELEFINGYIYANVWMSDQVLKIDPANGHVSGILDLSSLSYEIKAKNNNADVLNGIAYDPVKKEILVTGKLWPTIYAIKFDH